MKEDIKNVTENDRPGKGAGRPPITITVNEQPVEMEDRVVTGAEIKQAAIDQGVKIQMSFVLMEELPNGKNKTIGDGDEVKIRPHSKFAAIAPDDNS